MTTYLFIGGVAAFVVGVALVYFPAALMVAGFLSVALAVQLHRNPAPPAPKGDSS